MKKVCFFNLQKPLDDFHGYSVQSMDVASYFANDRTLSERLRGQSAVMRLLARAEALDELYREKHPTYLRFLRDFLDRFRDCDLFFAANFNPIHPEALFHELKKPIKILGLFDDPHSSYKRGVPYLWAFDGAFYISPSYDDRSLFADVLERWGCSQHRWWPNVWPGTPRLDPARLPERFFEDRDIDVIYVGLPYGSKVDRLVQLRKRLGSRLHVYGRWLFGGYYGVLRGLRGRPILWGRVRSISDEQRTGLYYETKIAFNMHVSEIPMETGNVRMYEAPAHGAMLLCGKAALDAHKLIYEPDKEAIFYDSIEDAIVKIEYYLAHDDERIRIARAGFLRAQRDYDWETNFKDLLDWASGLRKNERVR